MSNYWDNMTPWRAKCHRIINNLSNEAYKEKNPVPGKRHRPYTVPQLAADLVECLNKDDELKAKQLFLTYEGLKACENNSHLTNS
jgi:hypothetical protein